MTSVQETAFAKVNLDLRVCHRRSDGYHELDSVVVFADIGDSVVFETADRLSLTIGGPFGEALPNDSDNLVLRAARAIADMAGRKADVRITLEKRLPIASGLGGGSADAAAALRALIKLWELPLELADLVPLASTLGADVPVCLGLKAVRMQGIGDRLTPISQPSDLSIILVNPGRAVSTSDVFRGLCTFSGYRDSATFDGADHDLHAHLVDSVNDLELPAIQVEPEIRSILDALRRQTGCTLARMSGSGATCFGLFEDISLRNRAVSELSASNPHWWVTGTGVR